MLMYKADDVTRRDMSYDPADPAKGVRIFAGPWAATEGPSKDRRIILPQLLVTSSFSAGRFTYATSRGGEKRIVIVVSLLEPPDTETLVLNVDSFKATAESKFARFERVLMCGTLVRPGMVTNNARVVNPWRSPLLDDGTYDLDQIEYLNSLAPELARKVDLVGEIAVAYSTIATYTVKVLDREVMTEAGD